MPPPTRGLSPPAVCPDLVDKYLEETSIRYVTPRAHSDAEHGLGHPHKSGERPPGGDLGIWSSRQPPLWLWVPRFPR